MALVHWKLRRLATFIYQYFVLILWRCHYIYRSLTYNHFTNWSYAADVFMEPIYWFVDNFTAVMGPLFVILVVCLTCSIVIIAYWLGLPYWWHRNPNVCVGLLVVGNWCFCNVVFHFWMAVITHPGYPPKNELITDVVSICKKCITPKPPRTHHCSICNRCILKMDHHCPWLNNCVGHWNHRYFFLYMFYTIIGVVFLIVFGWELAYDVIMQDDEETELIGHSIFSNFSEIIDINTMNGTTDTELGSHLLKRQLVIYMALVNIGVLIALGSLFAWHCQLIARGETSIEAHINKAEMKRLAKLNEIFINPYDFGPRTNWRLFLGLVRNRTFLKHILFPSTHLPIGDGILWYSVQDNIADVL